LLTLEVLLPALTGVLSGYAALVLGRGVGRHFAVLGVFAYLLNALRLCLLGGAWLLLLMMLPLLPVPQRGALLSALLTLAALLLERFQRLCGPTPRAAWAAQSVIAIAPFAALGSLGLAERALPREALRSHAGEVVYALDGPRGHHVVSRLQGGLVLFSGEMLALTSADAPRFAESLAHPALAVARRRRAVLVLDDGTGSVEREVLRWRDVERLTLVPHDPSLLRLAKHSLWFQRLGADALADSRVQEVPTEAAPFVLNSRESFDVVLVNMGDPSSFLEGKYYTVGFLEALRLRLAPGGVLGMQVTSPLRTPETYASVLSTLTHAGFNIIPYVAPLPTLGEWGFVVAFSGEAPARTALAAASAALPHGTRFITPAVLAALFAAPASATGDARDSHLYDQPCVETYQREERALSD
jgi:spermidine synthase